MSRQLVHGFSILLLIFLVAIASTSCGSGQPAAGQVPVSESAGLSGQVPADPAINLGGIAELDRHAAYTDDDRLLLGSEFSAELPNTAVEAVGDGAEFSPQFAPDVLPSLVDPAYCIYAFNLGDYDQAIELAFGLSDPPASEEDLFYAVADYSQMKWDWYMSDGSYSLSLPDYENYISPGGKIYFAVAMTGLDTAVLDFVRIGGGFAPTGFLSVDVNIGEYPLTVNLTANFNDIDGVIEEYRWDFNNDSVIDETTISNQLEHTYEIPKTYIARVHAVDNDGQSATDFVVINVTGTLPPNPPTNVQASDGTYGGQVLVTWEKPTEGIGPRGYDIQRAPASDGTYEVVGSVGQAFTEFSDTTVPDDSVYWYRVVSTHSTYGDSDPSDSDDGFMGILNPPINVQCGQGQLPDRISIGWDHPTDGATPEGYKLYRSTSLEGPKQLVEDVGFVEFYQDTNLPLGDMGNTFFYFLASYKTNFSDSEYSDGASGYVTQLVAPTNVQASDDASPTTVTVTWTHSSGSQVPAGYNIYRDVSADGDFSQQIGFTGYVETFDDNSATDGEVYFYKVAAIKTGFSESPLSDSDSGYVGLGAPLALTASDDQVSEVVISWLPATTGPEPDLYEVFKSDTLDGTYNSIGTTASFTLTDASVVVGETYFYKAVAVKSGYNNSADSNIDDGTAI